VRQVAAPGKPLTVWGIRARSAPVITMLAFAPNGEATPRIVERPYFRLGGRDVRDPMQRLRVSGTVRQPYWSPQGEVVGAVLEDGSVVLLPAGAEPPRDLFRAGARLAAEGIGSTAPGAAGEPPAGRALVADRLGESLDALRPLPGQAQSGG